MPIYTKQSTNNLLTTTVSSISLTVGATGQYPTVEAAIASLPQIINHSVTITIQKGSEFTEDPEIVALRGNGYIIIQAETYLEIKTSDAAGATYLTDNSEFTVDDKYNDCWVLILNGDGKLNGFVKITDTVASEKRIYVAAWPNATPTAASKYMIVGALFGNVANSCAFSFYGYCDLTYMGVYGIGARNCWSSGLYADNCRSVSWYSCGAFNIQGYGIYGETVDELNISQCGIVNNNTSNDAGCGGVFTLKETRITATLNVLQNNKRYGFLLDENSHGLIENNSGDTNGVWGTYAKNVSSVKCSGTECSGSSGNHSNGVGDGSLAY